MSEIESQSEAVSAASVGDKAKGKESRYSKSESLSETSVSSAKSNSNNRGPPPPVPVKPPRVYALSKKAKTSTSSIDEEIGASGIDNGAKRNESDSNGDKVKVPAKSASMEELGPCIYENVFVNNGVGKCKSLNSSAPAAFRKGINEKDDDNEEEGFVTLADYYGPTSAPSISSEYQMKSVEIYIGDIDNTDAGDLEEDQTNNESIDDNMIPLIIDDYLPFRTGNSKSPCANNNLGVGEDETCITGCSWEMDDDDDATDLSTSSSNGMEDTNSPPPPPSNQRRQVGCSTATTTCVDSQLKDQIVCVKLAAKVVQCENSGSQRPPPPPPPVPLYPESSCASNSSEECNKKNDAESTQDKPQQSVSVSLNYNGDDEEAKDGIEPEQDQSSCSELYQNMVISHGLMIDDQLGVKEEKKVEPAKLPLRPMTVGRCRGVDDLTEEDEDLTGDDSNEGGHSYQNIVVKQGKFKLSTKKSNMSSSCDPTDKNLPFSSLGLNSVNGFSARIMELNEPSSDVSVPVVHAIINLPPRRANQIKERRRSRFENMSYQKSSLINQSMVANFKAAGNDRPSPSSLSMIRDGTKVMSINNCSDLGNGGGNEPGSIIGKVKIGFQTSLQKSKSVVGNHVEKARRKVGSWYNRRVKTPVGGADGVGRHRGSHTDLASINGSVGGEGGGARDRSRSQGRSDRSMTSTPADFLAEERGEDGDEVDGPDYSNMVFTRRAQSTEVFEKESEDEDSFRTKGQNEFEELRRVVKQGGDFCKDLASVLQERSELEAQYAKGLSKLSAKLLKASKEATGSVAHAWQAVAVQIDTQAELHRQWSTALADEVARPLRSSLETQHKIRKSVEVLVEKTTRNLAEWRTAESKAKRQCFSSSKEFEKLQESSAVIVNNNLNNAQSAAAGGTNNGNAGGGSGSTTTNSNSNSSNLGSNLALAEVRTRSRLLSVPPMEKDPIKLEAKRRKAEEAVRRADIEYYTFCVRSERARLEWESAIRNGSTCLRTLEEEKLSLLRDLAVKYYQYLNELAPRQVQSVESLEEPVKNCSVSQDMHAITDIRRHAGAEQLLPDFYAEDTSNLMKKERRQEALQKFLYLVNQDLAREKKGAVGIETLAKAIAEAPKIDTAHHDISDKLYYVKSMLLYLEGTRCKVDNALADIEGRQRINNPITQYMRHQRDKQGFPQTILKVPSWAKDECLAFCSGRGGSAGSNSPDWNDRGHGDGTSGQHETDFDEFSSQDSGCDHNADSCGEESNKAPSNIINSPSIGRCRAIYDYDANLFDELTIRTGDVINIHDKQEDGWWLGELNGIIGIFPATYVEEISVAESTNSAD